MTLPAKRKLSSNSESKSFNIHVGDKATKSTHSAVSNERICFHYISNEGALEDFRIINCETEESKAKVTYLGKVESRSSMPVTLFNCISTVGCIFARDKFLLSGRISPRVDEIRL